MARLCTWEVTTTFDENPSEQELAKKFSEEFPRTCERLKSAGLEGMHRLWLLTSFNSPEGRKLRYLLAVPEGGELQQLPRQIWLFAVADRTMRERGDGNFLFWKIYEKTLVIMVFFEGRLCHWSEEVGYGSPCVSDCRNLVESRLERFRVFLKTDGLFSRAERFEEVEIKEDYDFNLFKKAAKDHFWKEPGTPWRLIGMRAVAILALVVFTAKMTFLIYGRVTNRSEMESLIQDALPVELSLPEIVDVGEVKEESCEEIFNGPRDEFHDVLRGFSKRDAQKESSCVHPNFLVKGIVSTRLFMATVDGRLRTFRKGDSLGSFAVSGILRDRILLNCGDSLEEALLK